MRWRPPAHSSIPLINLICLRERWTPAPSAKINLINSIPKIKDKNITLLSVSMISSIKYISPALLFNKTFLKSYQYVLSLLYLIQSVWLYVDLVTNKFSISSVCIYWFHNDLLLVNCGMFNKSSSVIMLFIIAVISTYIILYSLN